MNFMKSERFLMYTRTGHVNCACTKTARCESHFLIADRPVNRCYANWKQRWKRLSRLVIDGANFEFYEVAADSNKLPRTFLVSRAAATSLSDKPPKNLCLKQLTFILRQHHSERKTLGNIIFNYVHISRVYCFTKSMKLCFIESHKIWCIKNHACL